MKFGSTLFNTKFMNHCWYSSKSPLRNKPINANILLIFTVNLVEGFSHIQYSRPNDKTTLRRDPESFFAHSPGNFVHRNFKLVRNQIAGPEIGPFADSRRGWIFERWSARAASFDRLPAEFLERSGPWKFYFRSRFRSSDSLTNGFPFGTRATAAGLP